MGLVAGEASGDALGARLIEALQREVGDVRCFGIAGPRMVLSGCEAWYRSDELSVLGLAEVLPHLRRLLAIRADMVRRLVAAGPDVFVGVDAKEFNLSLARRLHRAGLVTVQYVSPQVWAWRQGRVRRMHEAVDLVLCLLPFEKRFYDECGVRAEFVGHPMADAIPLAPDRLAARRDLGIEADVQLVALLPGSRRGEVSRLTADMAAVAKRLRAARPEIRFIAPMAGADTCALFRSQWSRLAPDIDVQMAEGAAQPALIACDAALVASGTATLEAALCKRPMVVIYRLGALTEWMIRRLHLIKAPFFAQPNLLAGRRVVGEYFGSDIDPARIAGELLAWLEDAPRRTGLEATFLEIHQQLKRDASRRAAQAIVDLLRTRQNGAVP